MISLYGLSSFHLSHIIPLQLMQHKSTAVQSYLSSADIVKAFDHVKMQSVRDALKGLLQQQSCSGFWNEANWLIKAIEKHSAVIPQGLPTSSIFFEVQMVFWCSHYLVQRLSKGSYLISQHDNITLISNSSFKTSKKLCVLESTLTLKPETISFPGKISICKLIFCSKDGTLDYNQLQHYSKWKRRLVLSTI